MGGRGVGLGAKWDVRAEPGWVRFPGDRSGPPPSPPRPLDGGTRRAGDGECTCRGDRSALSRPPPPPPGRGRTSVAPSPLLGSRLGKRELGFSSQRPPLQGREGPL